MLVPAPLNSIMAFPSSDLRYPSLCANTFTGPNILALDSAFGPLVTFFQRPLRLIVLLVVILLLCGIAQDVSAQVTHSFTEPVEQSDVAAAEPGVIANILVKEGQRVQAGQPLGELNNEVLQRSLQIAVLRANSDAKIRSTRANMAVRERKLKKLQPLLIAGHANPAEVEQAQSEFDAAAAELQLAEEESQEHQMEVLRIEAQIKSRVIHSPVDGWVTAIHYRRGEYIASTQPQFATVVKLDQLRARFHLLTQSVEYLQVGQPVNVIVGHQKQNVAGVIEFISPVTDADSGTARVDVLIDNAKRQYRSGVPCHWQKGESN